MKKTTAKTKPPAAPTVDKKTLALIYQWGEVANKIAELKVEESRLRLAVLRAVHPDERTWLEGTRTTELPDGNKLIITRKLNRSLDLAALGVVMKKLPSEFRVVGSPKCPIVYSPDLAMRPYRAMPEEYQRLLDAAIVSKPGMPNVEYVASTKG